MVINFFASLNFYSLITMSAGYALEEFLVSKSAAGFAASIYVGGAVFARIFAGRYIQTLGYKKMFTLGIIGMTLFSLVYFAADNYIFFCIVRFLNGFAFGVAANTAITIVSSIIPKNRSGAGVGYFTMSQIVGTAIGPYFAILLSENGYHAIFAFCTLMSALGISLLPFLKLSELEKAARVQGVNLAAKGLSKYFEKRVLPIAVLCFMIYGCYSSIISFVAVFVNETGFSWTASYIFIVYAAMVLVTRPLVGKLFDAKGPNVVLIPGIAVFALGFLIMGQSRFGVMVLIAAGLIGAGLGCIQTCTLAMIVGLVPRHRLGVANATYYIFLDTATAVGPVVAGLIITAAGYREMYFSAFGLAVFCLPLYWILHGRKTKKEGGRLP
ncbi:MAG: MFS transporter [Clostridiales Family XIII bacterium]|nr:MFS transporter [Clostridiales Family XIII bacterium]